MATSRLLFRLGPAAIAGMGNTTDADPNAVPAAFAYALAVLLDAAGGGHDARPAD